VTQGIVVSVVEAPVRGCVDAGGHLRARRAEGYEVYCRSCDFTRYRAGCVFEKPCRDKEGWDQKGTRDRRAARMHAWYMTGGGVCVVEGCGKNIGRGAKFCKEHGQLDAAAKMNAIKAKRRIKEA